MKHKLIKEGNESVTKCNQLKLTSPKDGKRYSTDVADMGLMFRIIESIPSKKAEPFKQWMTTREYKKHKGLTKENLRDNMTNIELLLNALAEETATEISKERNPQGLTENARIAKEGADFSKNLI